MIKELLSFLVRAAGNIFYAEHFLTAAGKFRLCPELCRGCIEAELGDFL